jgi:predicted protein tyrosine phosphatase
MDKYNSNILCVCLAGLERSPTLASLLSQDPYFFNTRSCGVLADFALIPLTQKLIDWSDTVCFLNQDVWMNAQDLFDLDNKNILLFEVDDDYGFMNQELIDILDHQLKWFLDNGRNIGKVN